MKKGKPEYPFIPEEAVLKLYEPERFYSHGDNPAMKRYMSLAVENCARGEVLDMRTYFIDQGKRYYCLHRQVHVRKELVGCSAARLQGHNLPKSFRPVHSDKHGFLDSNFMANKTPTTGQEGYSHHQSD